MVNKKELPKNRVGIPRLPSRFDYIPVTPMDSEPVMHMTGEKCWYCGTEVGITDTNKYKGISYPDCLRTIDHVIPKSAGGDERTKVVACYKCNQAKHSLSVTEFRLLMAYRAGRWESWQEFRFWGEMLV